MIRASFLVSALLLLPAIPVSSSWAWAHEGHMHHGMDESLDSSRPSALQGESIYNLDSSWTTQDGKKVRLSSLKGSPQVIAMIYTTCKDACPMTLSDLSRIAKGLSDTDRKKAHFAVFSFDSKRDTPAVLKKYSAAHGLDPGQYTFFHGEPTAVRKLAALLGIRYQKDKNGDFNHSNVITLVDSEGVIRHQQVGLSQDPQETIKELRKLLKMSPASG